MSSSLFKNKKGQVVDIFAGIQRAVSWLLQTAPKPLLIIIFLLFLVAFGAAFSFILNTTGNFCDTAGNEYSTGALSIVTNFQLISSMPNNDELTSQTLDADEYTASTIYECSSYLTNNGFTYLSKENKTQINITDGFYFKDDGCITCYNSYYQIYEGFLGGTKSKVNYCLDEIVYPKSYDDMSFLEKNNCGKFLGRCAIPEGYYYNSADDTFVCDDPLCMTEEGGSTTVGELWNLKLKEKGAKIRPESPYGDNDYRNIIRIECDKGELEPKLRVMGIEIFNYKIWLLLTILSALIWAVTRIKK